MKHDERIRKNRGEENRVRKEQECSLKVYNDSLRV